jgi:hypothetical protein
MLKIKSNKIFLYNINIQGEIMHDYSDTHISIIRLASSILLFLVVLMSVSLVSAHGPKGHGGTEFTALEAAKKGIELYDKLVASGKIENSWETDLKDIKVFTRQGEGREELVVKFSRSKGEPQSLYIFFTEKGEYNGSNFTGK